MLGDHLSADVDLAPHAPQGVNQHGGIPMDAHPDAIHKHLCRLQPYTHTFTAVLLIRGTPGGLMATVAHSANTIDGWAERHMRADASCRLHVQADTLMQDLVCRIMNLKQCRAWPADKQQQGLPYQAF